MPVLSACHTMDAIIITMNKSQVWPYWGTEFSRGTRMNISSSVMMAFNNINSVIKPMTPVHMLYSPEIYLGDSEVISSLSDNSD